MIDSIKWDEKETPPHTQAGVESDASSGDLAPTRKKEENMKRTEAELGHFAEEEGRKAQAEAFLRALMALVAKGEELTEGRLRDLTLAWREANRGVEGGENLHLVWVEGEALFLDARNDALQEKGWYVENAQLVKKTLDQLFSINILAIDYELEFGKSPPEEED